MDAIYYISGVLMFLILFGLVIAAVLFLIKPHLLQRFKWVNKPISRVPIFLIAIVAIFMTMMSFGVVLAATEPADVKAARIAKEAAEARVKQDEARKQQQAIDEQRKREEEVKKPVVKTETKTETIVYNSVEEEDGTLAKGQTRVKVEGSNGEQVTTFEVTYVQGKEVGRKQTKTEVTKQPITNVIQIGTYVAPAYTSPASTYSAPQEETSSAYYKNCSAAGVAGAAPVYAGQPGYGRHLDRDGDGIGCE